jgi:hypothetical protein
MTDCSSKKISSLHAALVGEMLHTDSVDEGQAGRSECNQHTAAVVGLRCGRPSDRR